MASMGAFLASFKTGKTVAANAMTKPKRRILTGIQIVKLGTAMRMKKRSARILLTAYESPTVDGMATATLTSARRKLSLKQMRHTS